MKKEGDEGMNILELQRPIVVLWIEQTCAAIDKDIQLSKQAGLNTDKREALSAIAHLALEIIKANKPLTDQELDDLDTMRKIRSGEIKKKVCHDYAIYNGDFYRKNPWNAPKITSENGREEDGAD